MIENIEKLRIYLKTNILQNTNFDGYKKERKQIYDLLKRTVECGESNSALLLGPRSTGKTALVDDVLSELRQSKTFNSNVILVQLNGFIHTDDRLALKSITTQMELENAVDGKVFGSFAETLTFLLACIKAGQKDISKSIIFILDEFDLFCAHHNQTLLYNLFDISQSDQTSVCVIGITCRLDVIELFEKRVKSRFSHRQFFMFPEIANLDSNIEYIKKLLLLSEKGQTFNLPLAYRKSWNKSIKHLIENKKFKNLIQRLIDIDTRKHTLKNILLLVVSSLSETKETISIEDFQEQMKCLEKDDVAQTLQDLNVLELCLLIAMKHHVEIYDDQPMNFEMILTRYIKFVNAHCNMQTVQRPIVMKAFEHIQNVELVSFIHSAGGHLQKEYCLFKLLVTPSQILEAVNRSLGLPTEVVQWANSSLI